MENHDSTTSSFDFEYDVFMSFKEGTPYAFTHHLYEALVDTGIKVFRDNGCDDEKKKNSLEKSRVSMIVFCDQYASSTRCLDKLVKIVECHEDEGKKKPMLAIFYRVEPTHVRFQKKSYEEAFNKHVETFGKDSEKVKEWRSALNRVCDFSGGPYVANQYETKLIKKIVKDTWAKLPPMALEINSLLGIDSRFEQVKSLLDIESKKTFCMLGIHGDGGIGKTTFAAYLYNKIRHQFQAGSFLSSVREKPLEELQMTLVNEMSRKTKGKLLGSTFEGAKKIKTMLQRKRVLLVLDDVDDIEQLESLAGGRDWFGAGSRVIITTGLPTVLDMHNVVEIKKYKMEGLNDHDSLKLFCVHAFNSTEPPKDCADICNSIVRDAKGSPRALKVIGSNLKVLDRDEWEMALAKYNKVPNAFDFLVDSF